MKPYGKMATSDIVVTSFRLPREYLELLQDYAVEVNKSQNSVILGEIVKLLKRAGKIAKDKK